MLYKVTVTDLYIYLFIRYVIRYFIRFNFKIFSQFAILFEISNNSMKPMKLYIHTRHYIARDIISKKDFKKEGKKEEKKKRKKCVFTITYLKQGAVVK